MRTSRIPQRERAAAAGLGSRQAEVMAVLTPAQRHILWLRVVKGRTAEEVAAELSMTTRAVRIAQHRALEALRARLSDASA